jgi:hypothetical protein
MDADPGERFDTSSSYHYTDFELLMKIATEDATMQACLKVVTSTCLAHGIEIECKSGKATQQYIDFVQRYYVSFCEDAIRCMFLCGFVPWRLRQLPTGALVPETIPLGTFVWTNESNRGSQVATLKDSRLRATMALIDNPPKKRKVSKSTEALSYKIRFIEGIGIKETDVSIYTYVQPVGVRKSSIQSPLSGIISEYRYIYRALARAEYADEWNTQGKLVCSYTSVNNMYNMNEGNPITNDWSVPQNRSGGVTDTNIPTELEQNVFVRDAVMERVVSCKNAPHAPVVYSMPKNSKLESTPQLVSTVDIAALQSSTARNIASIMGVPFEIIGGGYSDKQGGKKSLENSRVFITNMTSLCNHLQQLLQDVYEASFSDSRASVSFRLRASPRLEVSSIEELLLLINAGLLTTDSAFLMTNMILGLDLKHASGVTSEKYEKSKRFIPLTQEKTIP